MGNILKIFNIFLVAILLVNPRAFAVDSRSLDDGRDKNGTLIVAPTLALRCGIDSQNPQITSDCLDRLAYSYHSGTVSGTDFDSYKEMRRTIVSEYVGAYMENALKQLVESSKYKDEINEKVCIDETKDSCKGAAKDSRDEIEYNNKLAENNATLVLNILKLRAQLLNLDIIEFFLDDVVPNRDVDLSNTSLAGPP